MTNRVIIPVEGGTMPEVVSFGAHFFSQDSPIFSDKKIIKTESRIELAEWLKAAAEDSRREVKHAIFADSVTVYFYMDSILALQVYSEETNRLLISVNDAVIELKLTVPGCHEFESSGPILVIHRWTGSSPIDEVVIFFVVVAEEPYFYADLRLKNLATDGFQIYEILEEIITTVQEELSGKCKTDQN